MFTLSEGQAYIVELMVTNRSSQSGVPVGATLKVGIVAAAGSLVLLPSQESPFIFAAGETKTFNFNMVVPLGSVGKQGTANAWVKDPSGNVLATDTEELVIVVIAQPFAYSNEVAIRTACPEAPAWWYPAFSCRVTNPTGAPITREMTFRIVPRPGGSVMSPWTETFPLTLAAGTYMDWAFNNSRGGGYIKVAYGTPNPLDCWLEDDAGGKSAVRMVS